MPACVVQVNATEVGTALHLRHSTMDHWLTKPVVVLCACTFFGHLSSACAAAALYNYSRDRQKMIRLQQWYWVNIHMSMIGAQVVMLPGSMIALVWTFFRTSLLAERISKVCGKFCFSFVEWLSLLLLFACFDMECFLIQVIHSLSDGAIHWFLHVSCKSKYQVLRSIGSLHAYHHYYYNRSLRFNHKYRRLNFFVAEPCIFLSKALTGPLALVLLPHVTALTRLRALTHFLAYFSWTLRDPLLYLTMTEEDFRADGYGQQNPYHTRFDTISARGLTTPWHWFSHDSMYHVLHHTHPDAYMNDSSLTIFDRLFGFCFSFQRRAFLVDARGMGSEQTSEIVKFGAASVKVLNKADDVTQELLNADVLIVSHHLYQKDPAALVHEFVASRSRLLPPEVWAIGTAKELFSHKATQQWCHEMTFQEDQVVFRRFVIDQVLDTAALQALDWYVRHGFMNAPLAAQAFLACIRESVLGGCSWC